MMKLFVLVALVAVVVAAPKWHQLENSEYIYDDYVAEFHRGASNETNEYWSRKEIFEENLEKILAHNRNPTFTWKLGINKFTDRTEQEVQKMFGYHKGLRSLNTTPSNKVIDLSTLPASVDWRNRSCVTPVKDQGSCGSCWTFSAAETLESHFCLMYHKLMEFSEQQIASCTTNPKHCGGTGGCAGGTVEVAFKSVIDMGGIQSEWTYPYTSYSGSNSKCQFNKDQVVTNVRKFVQLPTNDYDALMDAIANVGPISISVDASAWSFYQEGIFDGCDQDSPDVNHAVQLVGYGTENGVDYWLVRNSWSAEWGEDGYIRVKRSSQKRCGTDRTPQHGSGCDGGPATVEVCGTCGILSDSVYPIM